MPITLSQYCAFSHTRLLPIIDSGDYLHEDSGGNLIGGLLSSPERPLSNTEQELMEGIADIKAPPSLCFLAGVPCHQEA